MVFLTEKDISNNYIYLFSISRGLTFDLEILGADPVTQLKMA
jgi:hypothetical protein